MRSPSGLLVLFAAFGMLFAQTLAPAMAQAQAPAAQGEPAPAATANPKTTKSAAAPAQAQPAQKPIITEPPSGRRTWIVLAAVTAAIVIFVVLGKVLKKNSTGTMVVNPGG